MKSKQDQANKISIRSFNHTSDWEIAHQFLDGEHYLGAGKEAGDRVGELILEDEKVLAILVWYVSAWYLKGRDSLISWDAVLSQEPND